MNSPSPEIAVVGAGIAGASAAYRLSELGLKSRVYEAEGHPGGRMASAVIDHASFDHGAQFFTTRGREFRHVVDAAAADGAVKVWTQITMGFCAEDFYHPRERSAARCLCLF